ncbi:hypothetical protein CFP56_037294 [Quercus suber]|uniref:Uncharacterized protein n=1 Tax=Quercus suber TaxID=58331 RepID=A0AAW0J4R4_QUESU
MVKATNGIVNFSDLKRCGRLTWVVLSQAVVSLPLSILCGRIKCYSKKGYR